jgi:beta-glucosidase
MGVDVDKVLQELSLDEKARLTAGADMWNTPAIERLGVPAVRVTDGPNGARGSALLGLGAATAACVPCGSALGATWNAALVERVGAMLGEEARTKACRVLLAPTINLHRSPLAGRNFECYSEDPLLAGAIAAGFVRGVQSQGVATTAKHFVANEAEFERNTIDSVVDERALRELYLVPFEMAVKQGGALGIMTAYNRLNGVYCAEDEQLLSGVLRGEWGFEGFVVTDWFAVGSTQASARAGLDLQMPGPGRFYGEALAAAVRAGEIDVELVDAAVERMLRVWDRLGALEDPPAGEERSVDRPEHRTLARAAATESMVLLRNDGVLPLEAREIRSLAVIGPNADRAQIMGGGSAALRPHYEVTPLEALRERLGEGTEVLHERGCWTEKTTPPLQRAALRSANGDPGLDVVYYAGLAWEGEPVHRAVHPNGQLLHFGPPDPAVPGEFSMRASGTLRADVSGQHTFTLIQAGRARLVVGGKIVLDGIVDPPPRGTAFFSMGSREIEATVDLEAGEPVEIEIEYTSEGAVLLQGARVGLRPPIEGDLAERAVAAATRADTVVMIVGTNADWESEGHDRASMDLPGEQDALIRRVCAANPRTIVVVNAGSPVTMHWFDRPAALLQIWFGGQEMAQGLGDVLFGDIDPSGRLPMTVPQRIEHNPSYGNFPGENSTLRYGEGLLVGYRWYESRHLPVRFPFGHGLSYSRFEIGTPRIESGDLGAGESVRVSVDVSNTGARRAAEVVQCYVAPPAGRLFRPSRELRAFEKVWLDPGESTTRTLELDARAFAYWDPGDPEHAALVERLGVARRIVPASVREGRRTDPGWYVDPGVYALHIGRSSAETAHIASVSVDEGFGPLAR